MCGIAGILRVHEQRDPPPPSSSVPDSWLDLLDIGIRHRGPDGHGRCRAREQRADGSTVDLALVHRRLSIIDHQGGAQPMVLRTPDPTLSLVFNGCIYNHRELRAELRALGARFTTDHSDSEVLLHAWMRWDVGMFARLDGMFALALFDHRSARLTLARDPYGEKPLFCSQFFPNSGGLVIAFASSPSPLVQLRAIAMDNPRERDRVVDPGLLAPWIKHGFGLDTPFTGITSHRPGTAWTNHSLSRVLDDDRPTSDSCNHFAIVPQSTPRTPSLDEIDHAISRSVADRLDADVPVGCFLSGGVDSALITALAAKSRPEIPAFTVRMPDPDFDESTLAAATARAIGVTHYILDCDTNPAQDLIRSISSLLLPFGDSSLLPTTWVSRATRAHATVALTGDGGDELFMGYDRHRALRWLFALSQLPHSLMSGAASIAGLASTNKRRSRAARLFGAAAQRRYSELLAIFPAPLDRAIGLVREPETFLTTDHAERFMDQARAFDLSSYLTNDLLLKTDTASMSVALEARAPLLSRELRALMLPCPAPSLLATGPKGLLRAVAARHLPESILARPKRGFAIPIGRWFRDNYCGLGTLLADTFASADPWPSSLLGLEISRSETARMLRAHLAGSEDHSQRLYQLLVLAIWCERVRTLTNPRQH